MLMNTGIVRFTIKNYFCYFKIDKIEGGFICSFFGKGRKRSAVKRKLSEGYFIKGDESTEKVELLYRMKVSGKLWKKIYEKAIIMF